MLDRVKRHLSYRYSRIAEWLQAPLCYLRERRVDAARQDGCVFTSYRSAIKSDLIIDPEMFFSNVYVRGSYERGVVRYLKKTVRRGMTCLDVGANIGYFALLIARLVGPHGQVFAFEPTERTFNRLKENIELNNFQNINPERIALSDHNGELLFHEGPPGFDVYNSAGEITHRSAAGEAFKIITVAGTTLDNYLNLSKVSKVDLVKIDVEGAELSVLKGMEKTCLNNPRLTLIIEFDEQTTKGHGYSAKDMESWLRKRSWQLSIISPFGNLVTIPDDHDWSGQMVVVCRVQ